MTPDRIKEAGTDWLQSEAGRLEDALPALGTLKHLSHEMNLETEALNTFSEMVKERLLGIKDELESRYKFSKRYNHVHVERSIEINQEVGHLKSEMQAGNRKVHEKREALRKADVSEDEIIRLVPEINFSEKQQRIDALLAEQKAWCRFGHTRMAKDLPEGADETAERLRLKLGIYPGGMHEKAYYENHCDND